MVQFPAWERYFSVLHKVQTDSGAHTASIPMGNRVLSLEVKQLGREIDNQLSSNAKIKNGGAIPPLSLCLHEIVIN
jgi:hypothetical protein